MRFSGLIVALMLVASACAGCGGDDDTDDDVIVDDSADDDITDDDSADDFADDTAADDTHDDDSSDDDTDDDIDDSDDDDDTCRDDTIDDTTDDDVVEPTYLFLMGEDANGPASWLQTDDGWLLQPIPGAVTPGMIVEFGPAFLAEGAVGYAAWNIFGDMYSVGHDWLVYHPDTGWDYDQTHGQSGVSSVLEAIFLPDQSTLWTLAYSQMILPLGEHLYRYSGRFAIPQLNAIQSPDFTGLFLLSNDEAFVSGYASALSNPTPFLAHKTGQTWSSVDLGPFSDGAFSWIWMTDGGEALAIWEGYSGGRKLTSISLDGGISEITTPTGCEGNIPTMVFAAPAGYTAYAIAVDRSGPDNRFWEMREGTWTCRNIGGELYASRVIFAQVRKSGRGFLAAWREEAPWYAPLLFEVTSDDLIPVSPPDDMTAINGIHAIGPDAPVHSPLPAPTP